MPFISGPDGDLKTAFVSDAWLLDQFVGNTLFTWGSNSYGNYGDNTTTGKSNPVQTVTGGINWKSVACGDKHTAAIKTDGTLWVWGANGYGRLGDNTQTNRSSPVQTVAFGTNWKSVACGDKHTSAIKTDGTLWVWGYNSYGQLGDNTTASKSSPIQTVAFGTNWKQVSSGFYNTVAIKTDGTLWSWGRNNDGQLGDNSGVSRSSPVQTITFGTNWKQVSFTTGNHKFHVAGIKTDGTLWLWGDNTYGALGDNSVIQKTSPVQTITGGTTWKQVACGYQYTAAIKTDGTLWTWGFGGFGQLGDNTSGNGISQKSSPAQTITFGTNWKQVAVGSITVEAIKNDGTLWLWGYNDSSMLGDNTQVPKSSPVQTTAYGTNWKQVSASRNNTAAVTNGDI